MDIAHATIRLLRPGLLHLAPVTGLALSKTADGLLAGLHDRARFCAATGVPAPPVSLLARQLFFRADRASALKPSRNKSHPPAHLPPRLMGHALGLAISSSGSSSSSIPAQSAQHDASTRDCRIRRGLIDVGVDQIARDTRVTIASFVRFVECLRMALRPANPPELLDLPPLGIGDSTTTLKRSTPPPQDPLALALVMRFVVDTATSRADVLDFVTALDVHYARNEAAFWSRSLTPPLLSPLQTASSLQTPPLPPTLFLDPRMANDVGRRDEWTNRAWDLAASAGDLEDIGAQLLVPDSALLPAGDDDQDSVWASRYETFVAHLPHNEVASSLFLLGGGARLAALRSSTSTSSSPPSSSSTTPVPPLPSPSTWIPHLPRHDEAHFCYNGQPSRADCMELVLRSICDLLVWRPSPSPSSSSSSSSSSLAASGGVFDPSVLPPTAMPALVEFYTYPAGGSFRSPAVAGQTFFNLCADLSFGGDNGNGGGDSCQMPQVYLSGAATHLGAYEVAPKMSALRAVLGLLLFGKPIASDYAELRTFCSEELPGDHQLDFTVETRSVAGADDFVMAFFRATSAGAAGREGEAKQGTSIIRNPLPARTCLLECIVRPQVNHSFVVPHFRGDLAASSRWSWEGDWVRRWSGEGAPLPWMLQIPLANLLEGRLASHVVACAAIGDADVNVGVVGVDAEVNTIHEHEQSDRNSASKSPLCYTLGQRRLAHYASLTVPPAKQIDADVMLPLLDTSLERRAPADTCAWVAWTMRHDMAAVLHSTSAMSASLGGGKQHDTSNVQQRRHRTSAAADVTAGPAARTWHEELDQSWRALQAADATLDAAALVVSFDASKFARRVAASALSGGGGGGERPFPDLRTVGKVMGAVCRRVAGPKAVSLRHRVPPRTRVAIIPYI